MRRPIFDNSTTGVRSVHNLGFNWTGSADFGRLVPFHVQELIGSDKVITCHPRIEMTMLPLASPTFGKMDLYVHYFFVPTRLLWTNFLDFYSESGEHQLDEPPYWTVKDFSDAYAGLGTASKRALYKHFTSMGLPPFFDSGIYKTGGASASVSFAKLPISLLPFRAYNQIWWDFYRDPEVISDASKSQYLQFDGGQQPTSATASTWFLPHVRTIKDSWIANLFATNGQGSLSGVSIASDEVNPGITQSPTSTASAYDILRNSDFKVYNDVNTGGSVPSDANNFIGQLDAIQLRKLEAVTRMAERLSLGGKRQIDRLYAKYGIKPEWSKLNMCQYIGGAKSTVLVSDITSTADTATVEGTTDLGTPLGMKAGAGYCAFDNLNVKYTASEPGYLIGLFSVMPHIHFVQGLGKQWIKRTWEDWFCREFEHIGQVAVPRYEVRTHNVAGDGVPSQADTQTFAFTQPYYDYKRNLDILAGDFAKYHYTPSGDPSSLDRDTLYMQSMEMYIDYNKNRIFNADSLAVDSSQFNKIFYYFGGSNFDDVDDHFHLSIDLDLKINRPMDGYAVPTIETTEVPHKSVSPVGTDKIL